MALAPESGSRAATIAAAPELVSDGQFVWGPNVGDFDLRAYLRQRQSVLAGHADAIETWAAYASVNPRLILAVLELKSGLVRAPTASRAALDEAAGYPPSSFDTQVEKLATELAIGFYRHLYESGSRRSGTTQPAAIAEIAFEDGTTRELSTASSSGSFAVASVLAGVSSAAEWEQLVAPASATGFLETYAALFPGSDPLDNSNNIDAQALPPSDFFQFPFPTGQTWRFGGAHNWNGSGAQWGRPYSSMDFSDVNLPKYAVAARGGTLYHPYNYSCWARIDHGGGWTTSYYHLANARANGAIDRNDRVGEISTATCAGGSATGAHVHFSLLYNGAYADLDGVQLSGWTIDAGNGDYMSGYIERGGVRKAPHSYVLNDYSYSANRLPATPAPSSPADGATIAGGAAPELCWQDEGDPDGDAVQFFAEVYGSPVNANSGWTTAACWRPSQLDNRFNAYQWRVKARDDKGAESTWSATRRFTLRQAAAITALWPPPPYCVLRYTREAEERRLEISAQELGSAEPHLQFRNLATGEESIYFAYEVTWHSQGYATIDMSTIKDYLWPDRKLSLAVRVTQGGAASYRPITDWSSPFNFADDVTTCGVKLQRTRLYLPRVTGKG